MQQYLNPNLSGDNGSFARNTTQKQCVFFDRAARIAAKSIMGQKHGCIVVLDGEIIAEGFNRHTMHMFHSYSVHAEVDCLYKINKKKYRHASHKMELFVVRIGPDSFDAPLKFSKPCECCQAAIEKFGIKKVYYSTNYEYETILRERRLTLCRN